MELFAIVATRSSRRFPPTGQEPTPTPSFTGSMLAEGLSNHLDELGLEAFRVFDVVRMGPLAVERQPGSRVRVDAGEEQLRRLQVAFAQNRLTHEARRPPRRSR